MTDKPKVPAPQSDETPSLPDSAAVTAYLEAHPDFFVEHEDLLATMRIPTGAAIPCRWSSTR